MDAFFFFFNLFAFIIVFLCNWLRFISFPYMVMELFLSFLDVTCESYLKAL